MADINAEEGPTTRVVEVLYCGHCSVPPEYCEFGTAIAECKAWLKTHDQNLFVKLYGETELVQAQVSTLDISCQEPAAVPSKSSKKTTPKAKVVLSTIERTKRKRITIVNGLEKFDVDLKKAAKQMASKFACGASVSKNAQDRQASH
ncbi:hypothetical protein BDV3_003856 [Batrachochytrium dendrobatidis]|nr:Translation machinery-associated protein 22 [Batrachochytrium dendrobatidis]